MKLNKKLAVFLLAVTSSLTILSANAGTSGGSGCIAQCQHELSACLSEGGAPKTLCFHEYRQCKNAC